MFQFKVLVVVLLIAGALSDGEGNDKEKCKGKGQHWQKIKQCMKQTKDLKGCCPFPKDETLKDDPECKQHLEGVETMEKKEKGKAYKCFVECIFKNKGLFNDGSLEKEKIREFYGSFLTKNNAVEFNEISSTSLDYCFDKIAAKQEKWSKWAATMNKTNTNEGSGPKCSFLPISVVGCVMGNIVRNCPESKFQSSNATCVELKTQATSMDECMNF